MEDTACVCGQVSSLFPAPSFRRACGVAWRAAVGRPQAQAAVRGDRVGPRRLLRTLRPWSLPPPAPPAQPHSPPWRRLGQDRKPGCSGSAHHRRAGGQGSRGDGRAWDRRTGVIRRPRVLPGAAEAGLLASAATLGVLGVGTEACTAAFPGPDQAYPSRSQSGWTEKVRPGDLRPFPGHVCAGQACASFLFGGKRLQVGSAMEEP